MAVGKEIALVAQVLATYGTHQLEAGVDAIAPGDHVRAMGGGSRRDGLWMAQHRLALHVHRELATSHHQGGRGQIERGHRLFHTVPRQLRCQVLPR